MAADELVDIFDAEGRVIATATRAEMRAKRLPHGCTYLLVFNRKGEVFVHERTATKDVYSSYWDVAVGGVTGAGESFETGARRELREEIGVEAPLEELFPFRYADERSSLQGMVYRVFHDGPFTLQPEEVVRGEFWPIDRVLAEATTKPFCPDGIEVLTEYRRRFPRLPCPAPQRVLLGSGGFRTPERVQILSQTMRSFFGDIERILFVPYALQDFDGYVRLLEERGLNAGYRLDGIHRYADPQRAVREAEAIYVGGGSTFRLLATLYRYGLVDVIRERVRSGLPFLGISAGCNVACPTIKTTNDMPICQPPSLEALGLVPFQVNPHYFAGKSFIEDAAGMHEHFGETRDDRLREFHEMNETPVVGLWEGSLLRVENGAVWLKGRPARVFRRGTAAVDVEAERAIHLWLGFS